MKTLDSKTLKKFLEHAAKDLKGEWLLVGGTLLPAIGIDVRPTVDIDLIGLGDKERASQLELMSLAEKIGLSVESINQAAGHFLSKVGYKKKDLIPLLQNKTCTIYRPNLELYWILKMGRLTESDYTDCQHYLQYCRGQNEKIDRARLKKEIQRIKKSVQSTDKLVRLEKLSEKLG